MHNSKACKKRNAAFGYNTISVLKLLPILAIKQTPFRNPHHPFSKEKCLPNVSIAILHFLIAIPAIPK